MKREILDKRSKEIISNLDDKLANDKGKLEKIQNSIKNAPYNNEFLTLSGYGSFIAFIEIMKLTQRDRVFKKFIENKNLSEDVKEYFKLQKERFEIVKEAEKMGLDIKISPEEDLQNFLNGKKDFAPENFRQFLKEREDTARYGSLTAKVLQFAEKSGIKIDSLREKFNKKERDINVNI